MRINLYAGDSAYQKAEKQAKESQGFSVDAGSYKGIRPAITVFSDIQDLLESQITWDEIIDNYLLISKEEYTKKYLTAIKKGDAIYYVKAYFDKVLGWNLIVEFTKSNDGESAYFNRPEWEDLSESTQQVLREKFESWQLQELA